MPVVNIALKVKAKNGVLQAFIDGRGWSQSDFAREIGEPPGIVCEWFNMKSYPRSAEKMLKVCSLIGRPAEEIFPAIMMDRDWLTGERAWTIHREVEIDMLCFHELRALPAPQEDFDAFALKEEISAALSRLTEREQFVVRQRMGIDCGYERTLKQVATELGVNSERVRQIEARAFRKLRHPRLSRRLKEFFNN